MVVELLVIVAAAVGIVDAVVCVPDVAAVYLAGMGCGVPVKTRPAVAFVYLDEGVSCGVGDGAALNLAAVAVLVPGEVVDARARDQGRVSIVLGVFHACTIFCALFDGIDPQVVDCAAAGVVKLP